MKKQEAPKLLRVRVNDHAVVGDLDDVPKQWVGANHFEMHPDQKEKINGHLDNGTLAIEGD